MSKIRIGVLGGTRGMDFVIRSLSGHPQAEVTAICEFYEPLLSRIKGELDGRGMRLQYHQDFAGMLAGDIDAVILANFANEHARYAVMALNAGKHVLSEVLPVQTMAEAVSLCEAVETSGKVYHYAENYCFFNQYFEMRRRYEAGDIGELVSAECDFINDCSFKWHLLTRGDRDHWRNHVPSTFYCTHSIGPMLYISGSRPEYVIGMETPLLPYMASHGARSGSAAMEIMKLENGAMAKSVNGNLKRPYLTRCRVIGTKGCMESDSELLRVYLEGERETVFSTEEYCPGVFHRDGRASDSWSYFEHGSFCVTEFFIEAILGRADGKYGIGVYQALDMSLPGLLAYRSILRGGEPVRVPDFRKLEERECYRDDHSCTDRRVAGGGQLLPSCSSCTADPGDAIYLLEQKRYSDSLNNSFKPGSN